MEYKDEVKHVKLPEILIEQLTGNELKVFSKLYQHDGHHVILNKIKNQTNISWLTAKKCQNTLIEKGIISLDRNGNTHINYEAIYEMEVEYLINEFDTHLKETGNGDLYTK